MRTTPWKVSKGELSSRHGLVSCQNVKAARAGAEVLALGGNAMDAAVATAATLSVVEPWLSGLGGGGFLLWMDGKGGEASALDFGIRAPMALDVSRYRLREGDDGDWFRWPKVEGDRNLHGYESIGVPGAVAGLGEALRRFGSLSWAEVLEPALAEARAGLEVDWYTALAIAMEAELLSRYDGAAQLFLPTGRAPKAVDGDARLGLATTVAMLERLREAGPADMYTGDLAARLVADLQAGGCVMSAADLAAYRPEWVTPQRGTYRGWDVHAMPGLSAGPTLLWGLAELERRLKAEGERPAPEAVLEYCRVAREAYAWRLQHLGHAATSPNAPDPSCTSHLSVVDRHGNMVSLTNTLLSRFGSRVVAPSLGLLMNNGLMWFDPRPGQPNSLAAGAKPLANMCPVLVSRDGLPRYALGAAGGRTIFPTLLQIMSCVFDYGMSLEAAFLEPRVDASTGTIRINREAGADVAACVEQEFPVVVVEDSLYPTRFSQPSAVMRDPATGLNTGMAYHNSPCAAVAEGYRP